MKAKQIINILSIGVIIGFFVGLASAIFYILANRFIQYKMFKLASFTFQSNLNKNIFLIVIVLLILIIPGFLIRKIMKWDKNKYIKVMLMAIVIVILAALLFLIFFLESFSGNILLRLAKVFVARLGDLLTGKISFSGFFSLSHQSQKFMIAFFLLVGSIIVISLLSYWVIKKEKWEKISKIIEVKYFRKAAFILAIFLIILNLSIFIEGRINSGKKLNVVILLIDALRKDHLGIYGYMRETSPNIDRFSDSAVVFQNAISQCSWTNPSISSLFSSLYPSVHGVISYEERKADSLDYKIATFAELLKEKGYATGAFVGNHWINKKFQFNQGFDVFDPINSKYKPLASELNEKALKWISKNKNKHFFAYLHYMDVHGPYEPPEPYDSFFKSNKNRQMNKEESSRLRYLSAGRESDNNNLNYYIDRYDGEIRFVDYHIGQILKKLEQYDLFNNTIIIIMADHGEAFFEHGFCDHGWSLYNEEIDIPVIVKFPEDIKIQNIDEYRVGLIDISATILHVLNCKFPYHTNGKNLLSISNEKILSSPTIFSEQLSQKMNGPPKISLIKDNFKAIYMVAEQQLAELYDLEKDKFEKENLINIYQDKYHEFLKEIKSFQKERLQEKIKLGLKISSYGIIDEQLREKLKSLGYIK